MASRSLGSLTLDLVVKTGAFVTGMTAAERQANKSMSAIEKRAYQFGKNLGTAIKAGAVLATAALTAVAVAVGQAIDRADEMRDLSIRTGVATEKLSEYAYAAKQTGTDIEGLSRGLKLLSKNAAEAADVGSEKGKLFAALGVNVKDAAGNLKQLDVLLPEVADKFKGLQDGTTKAALAQELFGKSGLDLIEFLNQGSSGLQEMGDKARDLGIIIGTDTANAADEFNDKLGDLKEIANGFSNQIAAELLPRLIELIDKLNASAKEGQLLGTKVSDIGTLFDLFSSQVDKSNEVGNSFRAMMAGISLQIGIVKGAFSDLINLNFSGYFNGLLNAAKQGYENLKAAFGNQADFSGVTASLGRGARNARGGSNRTETGGAATDVGAINRYLAGSGSSGAKKTSKAGKSDAEKEADKLKAAYDRMNESLTEQIALFGVTGEAAKLRYDLENGELSKLTDAQKQELLVKAERLDLLDKEKEAEEALIKARERQDADFNSVNDALKEQIELVVMSRDEMEIYNNLVNAGVTAESARGQEIIENTRLIQSMSEAMADQIEAMDAIRDSSKDFLKDLITGSKSFKDAFLDALDSIEDKLLDMVLQNFADQLFGKQGDPAGGSSGGFWASIIGAFFGGGKAGGGSVMPGKFYRVNESGAEMFSQNGKDYLMTGSQGGHVTPSNKLGGSLNVTQVFNNPVMADKRSDSQRQMQAGRQLQLATRNG